MAAIAQDEARITIEQVELPGSVRRRGTLRRVDYADAFVIAGVPDRSPRAWAEAMLSRAAAPSRAGLLTGWTLLGLRLSRSSVRDTVLGWPVHADDDAAIVLAAGSRLGLEANLVFERAAGGVTFATMVELSGPLAPQLWRVTEPVHVPIVRALLLAAARREAA